MDYRLGHKLSSILFVTICFRIVEKRGFVEVVKAAYQLGKSQGNIDVETAIADRRKISRNVVSFSEKNIMDISQKLNDYIFCEGASFGVDYGRRNYNDFISVTLHFLDKEWYIYFIYHSYQKVKETPNYICGHETMWKGRKKIPNCVGAY